MLSSAFLLLISGAFLTLRLGPGSGSFPKPLGAEEERAAVDAWLNQGDLEARNKLVEHNLRLVAHIVKKYYAQPVDQEDLISIGTIGLIKGVSTYRPDKNVRLATYASRCIENEILMYFRSQKKSASDLSLSEAIDGDGDGESLSLLDVLAEDTDMLERISNAELGSQALACVDRVLDPREAQVIRLRFGLGGGKPLTQREVAATSGISRSYVSRIEKKAMEKLRAALDT
ncbi:MAG: RNA polymerase sporulation sigma factor SigK [Oscillospiraceae bacterium]|nr:RNA polymerase sporulation sigma factor SigK [Oscillospiraceae bacterium]